MNQELVNKLNYLPITIIDNSGSEVPMEVKVDPFLLAQNNPTTWLPIFDQGDLTKNYEFAIDGNSFKIKDVTRALQFIHGFDVFKDLSIEDAIYTMVAIHTFGSEKNTMEWCEKFLISYYNSEYDVYIDRFLEYNKIEVPKVQFDTIYKMNGDLRNKDKIRPWVMRYVNPKYWKELYSIDYGFFPSPYDKYRLTVFDGEEDSYVYLVNNRLSHMIDGYKDTILVLLDWNYPKYLCFIPNDGVIGKIPDYVVHVTCT